MNILIIGANSRLMKVLGEIPNAEAVSHSNVPDHGTYSAIYVLSYSFVMEENRTLLEKVAKLSSPNKVLISSVTTLIGSKHRFRYPAIKRHCEKLAQVKGFNIVRIGLVLETMPETPKSGSYVVTSLADIRDMFRAGTAVCTEPKIICFWGPKGRFIEMCYARMLESFGSLSFLIRPIDLVLKFFGQDWYGYNSLIAEFYRKKIK